MGKKWDKLVARVQALEDAIAAAVSGKPSRKGTKRKKSSKAKRSGEDKKTIKKPSAPSPRPARKAKRKAKTSSPLPLATLP